MDILHYLNLKKPFYKKKTEENTKQTRLPEFFKFNITLEWFIPFKCTICEKVFNWFHPLKTRFTKPRFSENPHLVNKSLLTRHVTKWGFDCTSTKWHHPLFSHFVPIVYKVLSLDHLVGLNIIQRCLPYQCHM